MVDPPLLVAHQLVRYYHGRQVLHGIDLTLARGEVLGFLGPNGAGKSTTMNLLCGVLAAHGGTVSVCGHDLHRDSVTAKRHLGYLPEIPPLHLDATVDEYLRFAARVRGLDAKSADAALTRAKSDCDLGAVGGRLIANLSKGFRQRVGIAQAILHRPAVVVLDEPTSGLDPNQIRGVRATIAALAERHAVILSTHVLSEVQMLCNRVAILHRGRIVFNDAIDLTQTTIHARFGAPVEASALAQLDGVLAIDSTAGGSFRIRCESYDRAADAIARFACERGLRLRELARAESALEQVFVDVTVNDGTGDA